MKLRRVREWGTAIGYLGERQVVDLGTARCIDCGGEVRESWWLRCERCFRVARFRMRARGLR